MELSHPSTVNSDFGSDLRSRPHLSNSATHGELRELQEVVHIWTGHLAECLLPDANVISTFSTKYSDGK